jgi:uracil-DNA glycosylase
MKWEVRATTVYRKWLAGLDKADRARVIAAVGHLREQGPGLGRPFVGRAGDLLVKHLGSIGWARDEVFITNIVKCRPPGNRDPEPSEVAACAPYLERQLTVLDPALIVTLGRHSLQTFMPGQRIGAAHGTLRPVDPQTGARNALAYAMYHPAAALRQNSLRQTMLMDMAGVPDALLQSRDRRQQAGAGQSTDAAQAEEPEQAAPAMPPSHEPEAVAVVAAGTDPDNQMELF